MSKKNRILFLNTCHLTLDDRVFYHQAKSISKHGYEVLIVSTKEQLETNEGSISTQSFDDKKLNYREKKKEILERLTFFSPEIIICDSPFAVICAYHYKKNKNAEIIFDITEWYPSKKNLRNLGVLKRYGKFILLTMVNLYAGFISDKFIFGEYYKSFPFKILCFWKKSIILPYYPDHKYIQMYDQNRIEKEIKLLYTGIINSEKGIDSLIKSIEIASKSNPNIDFKLKIIGYFPNKSDELHFQNITSQLNSNIDIQLEQFIPFLDYCSVIGKSDLFFDLRQIDIENTHCLPIKLFYYLACGKPIIYSNLRSIRNGVKNINFGYLTDPNDHHKIAAYISNYIQNPELYLLHSQNARLESQNKYNWGEIENSFISFLEQKQTK